MRLNIGIGAQVSVGLPGAAAADSGRTASDGTVVYAHAARSASVAAQALPDGGAQLLVAIDGADAPTEYAFPVKLPSGVLLQPSGDGGYFAMLPSGKVLVIEAPWARDASGKAVPTSYRLDGQTLIQTIAHTGFTYPVVADPKFLPDATGWGLWFNRAETATIANGGWGVTGLVAVCLYAGGAPVGAACLAVAGSIAYVAGLANNSSPKKCVALRSVFNVTWYPFTYSGCLCTGGCTSGGGGGW